MSPTGQTAALLAAQNKEDNRSLGGTGAGRLLATLSQTGLCQRGPSAGSKPTGCVGLPGLLHRAAVGHEGPGSRCRQTNSSAAVTGVTKSRVSDPRVSCLLSASLTPAQTNLFT